VWPFTLTLVVVGFNPTTPQNAGGILTDPPISEPNPTGTHLAATKAASPPELPPTTLLIFHGFLAYPKIELSESKVIASCGTFPRTIIIAPAFSRTFTQVPFSL
jgi:hypothetical protein